MCSILFSFNAMKALHFALTLCLCLSTFAQARAWRNLDGSKTLYGDFKSCSDTELVITDLNGAEVKIPLTMLHPDDRAAAKTISAPVIGGESPMEQGDLIAGIAFGDDRDTVIAKLKASELVEGGIDERMIARTGINGVFRTARALGPHKCELFFEWSGSGGLEELTLRTSPQPRSTYKAGITSCWKEMVTLLGGELGKAALSGPLPQISAFQDDMALNTHMWRMKRGGTALVGVGQVNGQLLVSARFTLRKVQTVAN